MFSKSDSQFERCSNPCAKSCTVFVLQFGYQIPTKISVNKVLKIENEILKLDPIDQLNINMM